MSITAAARALGLAASTVSRMVRSGLVQDYGKHARPQISLSEARQARAENVDSWRRPMTGPGGSTSRRPHRTSLAACQAAKAQIELAELQASLVSRQDVEAAIALAIREIRSAFAGRWAVLAVELEGRSAHEIEAKLVAADQKLLGELVRRFEQIGAI